MNILTNCRTTNKRYNTNGVPLYDISCTYKDDYITIKGVQSYELKSDTLYPYLLCDIVYQTKKRRDYKVGYVTLSVDKITPTEKRDWLVSCIDLTDYDETFTTDKDKLQFIANQIDYTCFYDNNLKRFNNNKTAIIADHLQGLPSYFAIPFSYFDIINLGRLWGYDLAGEKEDKFIENYWNAIANLLLQTFKKYGVQI